MAVSGGDLDRVFAADFDAVKIAVSEVESLGRKQGKHFAEGAGLVLGLGGHGKDGGE